MSTCGPGTFSHGDFVWARTALDNEERQQIYTSFPYALEPVCTTE